MQFRPIQFEPNTFLLLVTLLCLFLVWSCGDGQNPSEDPASGAGALSFNVVYHDEADGNFRSEAAKIDCIGQGIATIEAKVYVPDNDSSTSGGPWRCDLGQGTISSVPAGSGRTVVVLGKNADESVILSGQKSDINVIADSENDVGTIDCYAFVPNLLAPVHGAVVKQDAVVFQWEEVAGAAEYLVLISQNSDMSDPVIEDYPTTVNYTPSGLTSEITYYWQVFGRDSDGNEGSGSQIWSVTITDSSGKVPDTGQEQIEGYESVPGEDMTFTINPPSYTKLDAEGNNVDAGAADWAMVRDNVTGLIWEIKTDDETIHDKDNTYSWQDAQSEFIDKLNNSHFGGYNDWRLPTIKELAFIVHRGRFYPAINTDHFPNTMSSTAYWSTTDYLTTNAWTVSFRNGSVNNASKENLRHVRAVRNWQPSSKLVDNGNGTVTDTSTGLMWQQLEGGPQSWNAALSYCRELALGEYIDWRLPNINELQSLVDYEKGFSNDAPAIDKNFFPNAAPTYYWTATTYIDSTDAAWKVNFNHGKNGWHDKASGYRVRAVRGGQ